MVSEPEASSVVGRVRRTRRMRQAIPIDPCGPLGKRARPLGFRGSSGRNGSEMSSWMFGLIALALVLLSIHDARAASGASAYLSYSEYEAPEHPNLVHASASAEGPQSVSLDTSALGLVGPGQPIAQVSASTAGVIRFAAQGDPNTHPYYAMSKKTDFEGRFKDTIYFHTPTLIGGTVPPIEVTLNFRAQGYIHGDPAAATLFYGGALIYGSFSTMASGGFTEVVSSVGMNGETSFNYQMTTDWSSAPSGTPYRANPVTGFVDTGVHSITYRLTPGRFDWGTPETTFAIVWGVVAQGFVQGAGALDFMHTIGADMVLPHGITFTTESGVTPNVLYVGGAANHAPIATDQSLSTPTHTALAVTLTGSDADNDPLTYSVVSGPTHGSLGGTAPNLTYTPALNYSGPDSLTFKVNDGALDSSPATVSITVTPAPPTAAGLAYFRATAAGSGQVRLTWGTLVEVQTLGYYMDRRTPEGTWLRVTSGIFPAAGADQRPHTYAWLDAAAPVAAGLVYRLVEVGLRGHETTLAETSVRSAASAQVRRSNAGVTIAFRGQPGTSISLATASSVTGPWTPLKAVELDGEGGASVPSVTSEGEPARFYRWEQD